MHNITVAKQQSMSFLKEIQVLRKAEKMHGLSESLADGILMINMERTSEFSVLDKKSF